MVFSGHGITLLQREIEARAPTNRRNAPGAGRRQKNAGDPLAVFLDRVRSCSANKSHCKAEAIAIAAIEVDMFGAELAREWSSIRNIISKAYSAWAAAGHPRKFKWSQNPE